VAFGTAATSLVVAVVAAISYPKKLEEAYDVFTRTLRRVERPVAALWNEHVANLDHKARELVGRLHPTSDVCIVERALVDLERDGWRADLMVTYALRPQDPTLECGTHPDAPRPSLAMFTPEWLSFQVAGTAGQPDEPPSSWSARHGFLFREWAGTDFPSLDVWYVHDGKLVDAGASIKLTDDSEHEYELRTQAFDGGLIGWGVPEGLFHMRVGATGKFSKQPGLPTELVRPNSHAVELRWSGTAFVDTEGNELSGETYKDGVVSVSRLAHVYVAGCEVLHGFANSTVFPGALVPEFVQSPLLRCGGRNEEDSTDVKVIPKD
jgi:hypothetical protein